MAQAIRLTNRICRMTRSATTPPRLAFVALFLIVPALAALTFTSTEAQAQVKTSRIGVLWLAGARPVLDAFRSQLRDLGYVEGRNVILDVRVADPLERLPEFAAEVIHGGADVVVALGSRATRAVTAATKTLPIVMVGVADPVGSGFVSSLHNPGGNVTGSTHISAELSAKRLQLLKEMLPTASRVAALFNPSDAGSALDWEETSNAARVMALALLRMEVRAPAELPTTFERMKREKVDAIVVFSHTFTYAHRSRIIELAAHHKLPAIYGLPGFATDGGLVTLEANFEELGRGAARLVAKILNGASPAHLPVERPTTFLFTINLKAARALGLKIPPTVLHRADRIIE